MAIDQTKLPERAILVGISTPKLRGRLALEHLEELRRLAETAGAEVVETFMQNLQAFNPSTLIGEGKIEEIRQALENQKVKMLVFDEDLSGSQVRNLENRLPGIKVLDRTGKEVSTMELSDSVFGITTNEAVMHMAVVNYLANQRQGTQSTLTRTEVSGGGRKPWRQKGTGHARQGSIRAPHWTHGGIALGPKPRDYRFSLNKKVRALALKSALSAKVAGGEMIVLDSFGLEEFKTKEMISILSAIGAEKKVLIALPTVDMKVIKSASNIPGVKTTQFNTLNVYDILNCDKVVMLKDTALKLEEVYA